MNITCSICGKKHDFLPPIVPLFSAEEIAERRARWLTAERRLEENPSNEHMERIADKAWFAYMATQGNGVPRIPDTIVTVRGKNGFAIVCAEHP